MEERKQYKSLDLFKFIFAILIVMIHAKPFLDISEATNWFISNTLFNLAVPFFFITSGFLLFKKLETLDTQEEKCRAVKKYVVHILKMYCVWTVIWLPLKILGWHTSGGIDGSDLLYWIKDFILTGQTGDALWYLLAVAVCAAVTAIVTKNGEKRFTLLLIISVVLYVVGVFISSWNQLVANNVCVVWYYKIFLKTENACFSGLLYFVLGAWISKRGISIKMKYSLSLFIISFCILIGEAILVYLLKKNRLGVGDLFTLPVASFFLFLTIKQLPLSLSGAKSKILRDFSTLIYVSHCLIIRLLGIVFSVISISVPYIVLFILTMLLSLTFSVLVRYLNAKNWKVIRLLY